MVRSPCKMMEVVVVVVIPIVGDMMRFDDDVVDVGIG